VATFCVLCVHACALGHAAIALGAGEQAGPVRALGSSDWDKPPPRAVDPRIPPAARSFQAALRTGAQLPWGEASDAQGDALAARYAWQVPILVDVGFKLHKPWFVGLYGGVGYGNVGSGDAGEEACAVENVSCSTLSYQLGVQAQYHLAPSDQLNPWLGLGAGYELFRQSLSAGSYREEQRTSGITLLKVMLGLDYRMVGFGVGPFTELSLGRFQATRTLVGGEETHEGPVEPSGWHGFLTLGARVVVMP
jgi:opacity protein-like surface antigen